MLLCLDATVGRKERHINEMEAHYLARAVGYFFYLFSITAGWLSKMCAGCIDCESCKDAYIHAHP